LQRRTPRGKIQPEPRPVADTVISFDASQTEVACNCPKCGAQFTPTQFDDANPYATILDRRPTAQRAYKGDKRRKPKLLKRAMRRADGIRRLTFYQDHDVDRTWLIMFVMNCLEDCRLSLQSNWTRAVLTRLMQFHLRDHGYVLRQYDMAPALEAIISDRIDRLFPDLLNEYGKRR
jgi:hypothetical protein